MLLCGGILLVARSPHVILPRILARTLLDNSSRWTLSFPNNHLVPGAFGEVDGVFRSQSSWFT